MCTEMMNACYSMFMDIEIHHHGTFTSDARNPRYIGGYIDVIKQFDIDLLSFRDLDDFADNYGYSAECLVHFKNDGKNMCNGMRLLYDDDTVRECVNVCKPYGKIELYIDHSFTDDLTVKDKGKKPLVEEEHSEDMEENDDSEDGDFEYNGSESEGSDSGNSFVVESDEELRENQNKSKKFRDEMRAAMATPTAFNEEEYESDDLRSIDSSSEDENTNVGYIGPPPNLLQKKKRKVMGISSRSGKFQWEVEMAFVSMEEFREQVRSYGLEERRGVHFVCNEPDRAHVKCEIGCPFRIWVRRQKKTEIVEIKTLVTEHLCTKPYKNKLASVKYLVERYGERIRKNPQWRVKEIIETIRNEMEVDV